MANDPKNRFSRHREGKPVAKADVKELSINERLKRVRAPGVVQTEIDGIPRSVWGTTDQIVEKPESQPKWGKTVATPTRVGKTVLDSETLSAKAAYENSRQGLKDQKSRAARLQTMLDTLSDETADAILQGWAKKHPEWYASPFNCQQLVQVFIAAFDQGAEGVNAFNIPSLEAVYAWMGQQRPAMFEKARRLRGEAAVVPFVYQPQVVEETTAARTVNYTVMTAEERAELKAMPFEDLQKLAQKDYKTPKRTVSDFRG